MARATLRVYAELNDFLSADLRQRPVHRKFAAQTSVKDFIEAAGIPHTEVDLILSNGRSVDFGYRVVDGDRVSAYPVFESIDVSTVTRVRAQPLRDLRFVLDVHLGRLAAYLRVAGFDTLYRNDLDDPTLADHAADGRVLLTRDRQLLKRSTVTRGYFVRATYPRLQLAEVLRRFDLFRTLRPFTRCLRCNATLRPVQKADVLAELPPMTRQCHDRFHRCTGCGRVYWQGTHVTAMQAVLDRAVAEARSPQVGTTSSS